MHINGIIAEYNPFHNGHKYQLEDAKKSTGAEYTVAVMSGNFVQRGTPALSDKFRRTRMALECGVDLVIELPVYYATGSAEYFAKGAVSLMNKLGCISHLCFGSESGDLAELTRTANLLSEEPGDYTKILQDKLKCGLSFPRARAEAASAFLGKCCENILASPNNILAIEYLKALIELDSPILPYTTERSGGGYNDNRLSAVNSSALSIRTHLFSGKGHEQLKEQMPEQAYSILIDDLNGSSVPSRSFLEPDDFSQLLYYKLVSESSEGYTDYLDVSRELSDRIRTCLDAFQSFSSFCDILKTKELTYTRISRCLLHILLDMKKSPLETLSDFGPTPYARVLGFRKGSAPLLHRIKETASIPLITKLADAHTLLSPAVLTMLENELRMNRIYEGVASMKAGRAIVNEYRTPPVII